jgi:hypothetical protein
MNVKQTIRIENKDVSFWMVKVGEDDINVMAEVEGQEPIKVIRLRPDGKIGLYKITNDAYPFKKDRDGYIIVR